MLDELLILGPPIKEEYHFQIVPLFLSMVGKDSILPAQGTTYRFSVHKGHHKFDQNRHPIKAHFTSQEGVPTMPVSVCKLNFYVPNYIKLKRHDFILRLTQRQCNQDFQMGEYFIDSASLIEQFKSNKTKRHQIKTFFSEDYELDFQIYVQKNRTALEQLVKEWETERMKKQPNPSKCSEEKNQNYDKFAKMEINSNSSQEQNQKEESVATSKMNANNNQKQKEEEKQQNTPKKNLFASFQKDIQPEKGMQTPDSPTKSLKIPLIQTKFKQLAQSDTPFEVKANQNTASLSDITLSSLIEEENTSGSKALACMWIFILTGIVTTYLAMHPVHKL